jgi:hypothetical protein
VIDGQFKVEGEPQWRGPSAVRLKSPGPAPAPRVAAAEESGNCKLCGRATTGRVAILPFISVRCCNSCKSFGVAFLKALK